MENTTHFGFKNVKTKEKQKLVKEVFDSVASKYDLMNDIMSVGMHRLWKKYTIKQSNVKKGDNILDIAGGTGDLAYKFNKLGANVILADINAEMLKVGRDKLINKGIADIKYSLANAEKLPFKDNSFNIITISFGLRNVTNKDKAISEFLRVLKLENEL